MALVAAVMMFMPKKETEQGRLYRCSASTQPLRGHCRGTWVFLSGIVGAAGAFITVPIMLVVLKIPTRVAIASSLAITFISSIGTTVGKVMGGHMLADSVPGDGVASMIASPLGAKLGKKMKVKVLQWVLAALITATVIKIWVDILM